MSAERNVTETIRQRRWQVRRANTQIRCLKILSWQRQSGKGVGKYEGQIRKYVVSKFYELWSTNGLKPYRSFTHPHYFVLSQFIAHPLCCVNVAPHSDSKWNGIGFVCSSDLKPQKMLNRNAIASSDLKWQYIAIIATFLVLRFFF